MNEFENMLPRSSGEKDASGRGIFVQIFISGQLKNLRCPAMQVLVGDTAWRRQEVVGEELSKAAQESVLIFFFF